MNEKELIEKHKSNCVICVMGDFRCNHLKEIKESFKAGQKSILAKNQPIEVAQRLDKNIKLLENQAKATQRKEDIQIIRDELTFIKNGELWLHLKFDELKNKLEAN